MLITLRWQSRTSECVSGSRERQIFIFQIDASAIPISVRGVEHDITC